MHSASGPTIRTVAARAGVSIATVSYVLSGRTGGHTRVSEGTRARVVDAAAELGYVPNQSARGVRCGRTDQVCLVLRSPHTPSAQALADTVSSAMSAHRLNTLMLVGGDWENFLLRRGADGAFVDLRGAEEAGVAGLRRIVDRGIALVVMHATVDPDGFDVVRPDETGACGQAVALLSEGHRRIGWLGGRAGGSPRYAGYVLALRDAGLGLDESLVRFTGASREHAYEEALRLLRRPDRPTAIVAASDLAAISALWAAQRLGLRVPEDLAIVGAGNSPEGAATEPPITTVGPLPFAADIAGLLLSRLAGEAPVTGRVHTSAWVLHRRGTA
ncbi:LacI family transcriptional regulator [Amycolatopsis antarctica]|uniref:LacI family transcriptional regulator n=1 Tax=Amycolatopsis antarctica TaxID=1854586 RepID=A0A263D350_9PSEU|nr:LacI family DNA-binding transcriptional regulator [Amycolatopsis antarctica]OZM72893.1 LacI family transcriptional regulator [Amycolatopsis antarctica]